jgi:hypothetical protein
VAAKQEQYKVKSEKNAVELATRQTIQEVNRQLKGDIEELDRHVQKNGTRQKAENCRLHLQIKQCKELKQELQVNLMELDQRVINVENKVGVDFSIPGASKSPSLSPKSPKPYLAHMNTVTTLGQQSIGEEPHGGMSRLNSNI